MKRIIICISLSICFICCESSKHINAKSTWIVQQLEGRSNRGTISQERTDIIIPFIKDADKNDSIVFITDFDASIPKPLQFNSKRNLNYAIDSIEARNTGRPRNWDKDKPAITLPRLIFLACNRNVDEIIILAGKNSNFNNYDNYFDEDWNMRANGLSGAKVIYLQNFVNVSPEKVQMVKDFLAWKISEQAAKVFFSFDQVSPHKVPDDIVEKLRSFATKKEIQIESESELVKETNPSFSWGDEITITLNFVGGGFYRHHHKFSDLDLSLCRNDECLSVRHRAPNIGRHFQERESGKEIVHSVVMPEDYLEISFESGPRPTGITMAIFDAQGSILLKKSFPDDMFSGHAYYPTKKQRASHAWWSTRVRTFMMKDLLADYLN